MEVEVLLFGIAREIVGESKTLAKLNEKASVKDLRLVLIKQYPKLDELNDFMIAVNNEYAKDSFNISENDEVALIPPVSGG